MLPKLKNALSSIPDGVLEIIFQRIKKIIRNEIGLSL